MRDLTKEELGLAPDWATHYNVLDGCGAVLFESAGLFIWSAALKEGRAPILNAEVLGNSMPIIREPFDIKNYECEDKYTQIAFVNKDYIDINCCEDEMAVRITKRDCIALAKALNITAKDLE